DVDDNGTVNVRDYGRFQQYLNGFEVAINLAAANVDGNSSVNVRDLGRLQQYLNGWDVQLGA
ncbi:MAG: dockerin type I repeat-containing protein, partial [Clostridia bacterium]|nr:dockerin type I repeat-containing protein [Clostridia bacterium]